MSAQRDVMSRLFVLRSRLHVATAAAVSASETGWRDLSAYLATSLEDIASSLDDLYQDIDVEIRSTEARAAEGKGAGDHGH